MKKANLIFRFVLLSYVRMNGQPCRMMRKFVSSFGDFSVVTNATCWWRAAEGVGGDRALRYLSAGETGR